MSSPIGPPDPRYCWYVLGRWVRLEYEAAAGVYRAETAELPRVRATGRTRADAIRALAEELHALNPLFKERALRP